MFSIVVYLCRYLHCPRRSRRCRWRRHNKQLALRYLHFLLFSRFLFTLSKAHIVPHQTIKPSVGQSDVVVQIHSTNSYSTLWLCASYNNNSRFVGCSFAPFFLREKIFASFFVENIFLLLSLPPPSVVCLLVRAIIVIIFRHFNLDLINISIVARACISFPSASLCTVRTPELETP